MFGQTEELGLLVSEASATDRSALKERTSVRIWAQSRNRTELITRLRVCA